MESTIATKGWRGTPAAALAVAAALVLLGLTALPGTASAKLPRIYDGTGLSVKPDTISDFDMTSESDPKVELLLGGPGATRSNPGKIVWKRWTAKRAVGIATGWTLGCKLTCGMKAPWDGGKVRITAFRRNEDKQAKKQNRFSRVKVYQPDSWRKAGESDDYYRMNMIYTGAKRPGSGWFVFGVHYPADLEPDGMP